MIIKVAPHTLSLAETIAQLLMGIFAIETFMDASKFPRVGGGGVGGKTWVNFCWVCAAGSPLL